MISYCLTGMFLTLSLETGSGQVLDDHALIGRVAEQRDQRALRSLYDRHSKLVFSQSLRIVREAPVAEEVLQDVFFRLWTQADRFDSSRGPLLPWILTMARNAAIDRLRARGEKQRRAEFSDRFPDAMRQAPATQPQAEAWMDRERTIKKVRILMNDLSDGQRRALELAYFEGLTQSEIAARLEAPLGTVKSWLRQALKRLRTEIGGRP